MPSSPQQPTQQSGTPLGISQDELSDMIADLQSPLLCYITSIMGSTKDSDDILQETNLFLWSKIDDFEAGTNFRAWAYKVAYFKAMACRRDNINRGEVSFSEEITQRLASKAEPLFDSQPTRLTSLAACLSQLPPQERMLLEIKYISRKSLTEHALAVGKSANTIHKTVSRLRIALKKCVESSLKKA